MAAVGPAGLQTVTLNLRRLGTQGYHRPSTLLCAPGTGTRRPTLTCYLCLSSVEVGSDLGEGLQFTLAFATGLSLLCSSSSSLFIIYFHHLLT